ncbi:MAG TPA: type VII secretion protein EccB [Pseudonocardiaceae bacterium]|nr:type VII secretion protein EccB [Pseudonocardiaceae bacterium]
MPSTPTSKSQVQAYRFVLRRMESALVRKDPVMLHDPMRSHKRSTIVGVILGVVGLVVFVLIGVLNPAPPVPASGIVIAEPSSTIYVVSQNPHEFIPVFNLASARLLLAATTANQQSGASTQGQGQAPAVVQPTIVQDSQLKSMPMGRMTGIPLGPTVLPNPGAAPTDWAVCDKIPRDVNANVQTGHTPPQTTAIVGEPNIGTNLPAGKALLVSNDGGKTLFLVYGLASTANNRDDSAVRAQIDTTDPAVLGGLLITGATPYRVVSTAVLNAIPTVGEIRNPSFGLDGNQPVAAALAQAGVKMGQSFSVQEIGNATLNYYIAVPGGKQAVSATVAQIARHENSGTQADITQVAPQAGDTVPTVIAPSTSGLNVDVSQYPDAVPAVITADTDPVMCLGWRADYTDKQKPLVKTRVTVDFDLQMPVDTNSPTGHMTPVQIGQGTSAGKIDYFFMNPAIGGVAIRSANSAKQFANGPIYVIDPSGVAFSVPDVHTAQVLGIADATPSGNVPPAPASIAGLLPLGGEPLDIQSVQKTFDSMQVPTNVGQYMVPTTQPGS